MWEAAMFDRDNWILNADFSTLKLDKWQKSIDLLTGFFKSDGCSIAQHSPLGYRITMSAGNAQWPYQTNNLIPETSNTLIGLVVSHQQTLYIPNTFHNAESAICSEVLDEGVMSYLGMPIFWPNGHLFGVIGILHTHATEYQKNYLDMAENIRLHIQTDLHLFVSEEETYQLALTDKITGIYNRKGFDTLATYKLSLAKRYGHNFGLMYFNLDNLGSINEQLGWEVGNKVLIALAEALNSELRESDIAVRLGEDDFAALVFIREHNDLENIAVRIQRKLNMLKQSSEQLPPITTSVGARWYEAGKDLDITTTLGDIDRLMFAIKQEKKQNAAMANMPKH